MCVAAISPAPALHGTSTLTPKPAANTPTCVRRRAARVWFDQGTAICWSAIAGVLSTFSREAFHENIPHDFLPAFIIAMTILSAFVAGFVTAKIAKQRGLLCGSISGLLLFLLFLIAGVAMSQGHSGVDAVMRMILMILSGGIGGLISVNGKSHAK